MDLNTLLRTAVERGASDVHLKVGPAADRSGTTDRSAPLEGWAPLDAAQLELVLDEVGAAAPARLAGFHETGELDTAYQQPGLPRFRVNAFRQRGDISFAFRAIPTEVPTFDHASPSARRAEPRRGAPRPDPRHRRDRRRQDDDARLDARPHQPHAAAAHRHDRGSDRDPPLRRELHRQPARGRARHRLVQPGAATRAAAGPRHHPDRRAPRRRDGGDGAPGGRVRPPRAVDDAHARRGRDGRAHGRVLPGGEAGAGALDPRRRAARRGQPAPRSRASTAAAWRRSR